MRESYDVLIVGAGPAGLATALGVSVDPDERVLLVEAGSSLEERSVQRDTDRLTTGVGGAGLYSDGKLCMSLSVGGSLPLLCDVAKQSHLLELVASMFEVEAPPSPLKAREVAALELSPYPVVHLGTDGCTHRMKRLTRSLRARGVELRSECRLVNLHKEGTHFRAELMRRGSVWPLRTSKVVLAMGKVGSAEEERLATALGADVEPLPMYVGVRLESPQVSGTPLFTMSDDPKLKLYFDDGSKCKTHCAADGGGVLPLYYADKPLVGGHAYSSRDSGRSSVSILWNGLRKGGRVSAETIMQAAADVAEGRLLVQRLTDYRSCRSSRHQDVLASNPTTDAWTAGDLRSLLPLEYFSRFDSFLSNLAPLWPQLNDDRTLVYGPAIEWWMNRLRTDAMLQTSVQGLYAVGDGAGWSQGIVHASASGLLAAEGILQRRLRPEDLSATVFAAA